MQDREARARAEAPADIAPACWPLCGAAAALAMSACGDDDEARGRPGGGGSQARPRS